MSFLGGAECSTAANPLAQFTKHVGDDKSLQRDRLVGRGPGGLQEGMRGNMRMGGEGEGMMDEFMQQPSAMQGPQAQASPMAMEQMRREFEQLHTGTPLQRNGSPAQHNWAAEFAPEIATAQKSAGFNPAEFEQFVRMKTQSQASVAPNASSMAAYQHSMGMGYGGMYGGMGMGGMGMQRPYGGMYQGPPAAQVQDNGKGKERMVELDEKDWEQQFADLEATHTDATEALDTQANRAMEDELEDIDRSVLSDTDRFGDFEDIWKGIQAETLANGGNANRNFFGNPANGEFADWDDFDQSLNTHMRADPQLGDYLFEEENIFSNVSNPFEEGVRIMDDGGNLSLAALAFEAAVQKDPQHVEAWTRLGASQAQNEKESPAIRALEQAIKLDPSNLEALMGLAVSYTNEGYDSTAYRTLERWLAVKYPQVAGSKPPSADQDLNPELGFTDRAILHDRVTDLFIQAAQLSPDPQSMDPDVQVGLGVLFYGAEEFDKAVDCFSAALHSSESGTTTSDRANQRPLLWNRLGATLANSGRSEEAIEAYEHALQLNPSFVRARYNLGVSCINIGCYDEAAQHLLGALAMHKVVEKESKEKAKELLDGGNGGTISDGDLDRIMRQNQSTNLYDTLRRVFGQMGRKDLADKVVSGVDVDVFRQWFDF